MKRQKHFWTQNEIEILHDLYPHVYTVEITKYVNHSLTSIYQKAYEFGLKKSDEFNAMKKEQEGNLLRIVGVNNRFVKGQCAHNKGRKMPDHVKQKVSKTWFKKGQNPSNTKYDGHERIDSKDGYVLIRVEKGKYQLKQRVIWENHNGPIPANHVIIFKDGDKYNFDINNLECISSKENMLRNTIQRYPEEVKSCIKLLSTLKKQINATQQN